MRGMERPMNDLFIYLDYNESNFVEYSNFGVQGITHDVYIGVGNLFQSKQDEAGKQRQFEAIQYDTEKAFNVISKAREMLRVEELRVRLAFKAAKKIRQGHSRFHSPDWRKYHNEFEAAKVYNISGCIECLAPTDDLVCEECITKHF